jgi:hypothetical protein
MFTKKNIIINLFIIFFSANFSFAQLTQTEANATIENFFSLCKKGDFHNSAKLLIYFGQDKVRLYKDFFNPDNPDEFKEVKRICKKVNATLLISDSYTIGKLRKLKFNGETVQGVNVLFKSGKQKIRKRILLKKINDKTGILDYS